MATTKRPAEQGDPPSKGGRDHEAEAPATDVDSAGVYYMTIEAFERRRTPDTRAEEAD